MHCNAFEDDGARAKYRTWLYERRQPVACVPRAPPNTSSGSATAAAKISIYPDLDHKSSNKSCAASTDGDSQLSRLIAPGHLYALTWCSKMMSDVPTLALWDITRVDSTTELAIRSSTGPLDSPTLADIPGRPQRTVLAQSYACAH